MSIWDAFEKAAYTGLGLAALTKEKIDEAADTLRRERGLTEAEGRHLAREMKEGADEARKNLDERISTAVDQAIASVNLASRKEVEELKQRVAELEAKLNESSTKEEA
ncbi:MAG: phasin family protein [Spirochaetales bacterium]|nr:phasin family protein [Spirochaetales bacterium]